MRGEPADARSDVFALGTLIREMLWGHEVIAHLDTTLDRDLAMAARSFGIEAIGA